MATHRMKGKTKVLFAGKTIEIPKHTAVERMGPLYYVKPVGLLIRLTEDEVTPKHKRCYVDARDVELEPMELTR